VFAPQMHTPYAVPVSLQRRIAAIPLGQLQGVVVPALHAEELWLFGFCFASEPHPAKSIAVRSRLGKATRIRACFIDLRRCHSHGVCERSSPVKGLGGHVRISVDMTKRLDFLGWDALE
jgi:hypothetical protein